MNSGAIFRVISRVNHRPDFLPVGGSKYIGDLITGRVNYLAQVAYLLV